MAWFSKFGCGRGIGVAVVNKLGFITVIGGFIGNRFTGGRAIWIAGLIGLKSVFCTGGLMSTVVV